MALLKHPLTLLGRRPGEIAAAARALERGAFRDIYVGQGLAGAPSALEAARKRDSAARLRASASKSSRRRSAWSRISKPLLRRSTALADRSAHPASRLAEAHGAVAEALARDDDGSSSGLWQGDAGEALSVLLAELIDAGDGLAAQRRRLSALLSQPARRRGGAPARGRPHPRLFIWGPLEARLQQPDVVILGSLNEGVWPRHQEAGPWLSRPMRETLGLPPPERRIGLSAHDFAQGARSARSLSHPRAQGRRRADRAVALAAAAARRWSRRRGSSRRSRPSSLGSHWARERDHGAHLRAGRAAQAVPAGRGDGRAS